MATQRRGIGLAIGLNAVDPAHYRGWSGKLRSCEADAAAFAEIGRASGFEMTTLLTAAATRAALMSALDRGAQELAAGDMLLLAFSGHGGQVRDQDGDENDGLDETWCLHDGIVIDDELRLRFAGLAAGVRVLVVSDSCHSGTVTRNSGDGRMTVVSPPPCAIVRAMPGDVAIRTYEHHKAQYGAIQRAIPPDITAQIQATVRLISACQDNQFALDGQGHGVFTGALLEVWSAGSFTGTYDAFHRAIVSRLATLPLPQTPNHLVIGAPSPAFDAERPFTL
jgi:hypothetical protein